MQEYKMQWKAITTGLAWEYNYEMVSDEMAIDYARCHVKAIAGARSFTGLLVWRLEPGELIADLVLDEPSIRNQLA